VTGGGLDVLQLSVQTTIIAGNTGSATSPDVNGAVTSASWNLIGITDGSSDWTTNDFLGNSAFKRRWLGRPQRSHGVKCPSRIKRTRPKSQ
jgi:hypothetical protein